MKRFITYTILVSLSIQSNAQHINELSNEVMLTFKKSNPNIKNVQWTYTDSNLIAQYKKNIYTVEKTFSKNGKLIKTKLEIEESFLPKPSSDFIAKYYSSEKLEKVYKIFDDSNKIFYQADIKFRYLFFDMNGNYIYSKPKIE